VIDEIEQVTVALLAGSRYLAATEVIERMRIMRWIYRFSGMVMVKKIVEIPL
jgi:hypothetical protein